MVRESHRVLPPHIAFNYTGAQAKELAEITSTVPTASIPSIANRSWIRSRGHILWVLVTLAAVTAAVLSAIALARSLKLSSASFGGRITCDPNLGRCVLDSGTILRMSSPNGEGLVDLQATKEGMAFTVTDNKVGGAGAKTTFKPDGSITTSNPQTGASLLNISETCLNQAGSCGGSSGLTQ